MMTSLQIIKLISHWHGCRLSKEVSSSYHGVASPHALSVPPLGPLLKYLSEYAGLGIFSLNFVASCVDFCKIYQPHCASFFMPTKMRHHCHSPKVCHKNDQVEVSSKYRADIQILHNDKGINNNHCCFKFYRIF